MFCYTDNVIFQIVIIYRQLPVYYYTERVLIMKRFKKECFFPVASLILVFIFVFSVVPLKLPAKSSEYSTAADSIDYDEAPTVYQDFYNTTVYVPENPPVYNHLLYSVNNDHIAILGYEEGLDNNLIIPDSIDGLPVTYIYSHAFNNCKTLESVKIPDSVTEIGTESFSGCEKLTSVSIPDGVTAINDYTFYGCKNLKEVIIPGSVTRIGWGAFYGCDNLTSVSIPDGVTVIRGNTFYGCKSLEEIVIPGSVTEIGGGVFYGCENLTSVSIPDGVTVIRNAAFDGCKSLEEIVIPDGVTEIEPGAFLGCEKLKEVKIPGSVTEIGWGAFYGCDNLTSVSIPDGVTVIRGNTFYGCKSLEEIVIPGSVTEIESYAFYGCFSIESISVSDGNENYEVKNECLIDKRTGKVVFTTKNAVCELPEGTTKLYYDSFDGFENAKKLILPSTINETSNDALSNMKNLSVIEVNPENENFMSIDGMLCQKHEENYIGLLYCPAKKNSVNIDGTITGIDSEAFRDCADITEINAADSGAFTVKDGILYNSDYSWLYLAPRNIKSVTIPAETRYIANCAFCNCAQLTDIDIPDTVESLNYAAFSNCTALKNGNLGKGITDISNYAFSGCSSLASITIPDNVTNIGWEAFSGCSSLASITIPDSVTYIGWNAFYNCTSLTDITVPDSVTNIGSDAFYNTAYYNNEENWDGDVLYINNHLIDVDNSISGDYSVRQGTKTIAEYAFSGCDNLTGITIPDSVVTLGNRAFDNCSNLREIRIGAGVKNIDDSFNNCKSVKEFTVSESNPNLTVKDGVIYNKELTEIIAFPEGRVWENDTFVIPETVEYFPSELFDYSYNVKKLAYSGTWFIVDEYGAVYSHSMEYDDTGTAVYHDALTFIPNCDSSAYTVPAGTEVVTPGSDLTFRGIEYAGDYLDNYSIYDIGEIADGAFYDSTKIIIAPESVSHIYAYNSVVIYNGTKEDACRKFGCFNSQANENAGKYSADALIICNPKGEDISRLITEKKINVEESFNIDNPEKGETIYDAVIVNTVSKYDLALSYSPLTDKEEEAVRHEGYLKYSLDISLRRDGVPVKPENPVDIYFSKDLAGNDIDNLFIVHQKRDNSLEIFLSNPEDPAYKISEGGPGYENYWKITVTELSPFAVYNYKEKYTATFIAGGNTLSKQDYFEGDTIVKPAVPVMDGRTFEGWSPEVPEKMPAADMTFIALLVYEPGSTTAPTTPTAPTSTTAPTTPTAPTIPTAPTSTTVPTSTPTYRLPDFKEETAAYKTIVTVSVNLRNLPDGAEVYIGGNKAEEDEDNYSANIGQITSSKDVRIEVRLGGQTLDSSTLKIKVETGFFSKLVSFFSNFFFNSFKWKEVTVKF